MGEEIEATEEEEEEAAAFVTKQFHGVDWDGANPDVVKARIALEEKRLQMEERLRVKELDLKMKEAEIKDQQWRKEFELRTKEYELKKKTVEHESVQKDSTGAKLKLWGDALRNAVSKMPSERIDIVSWFICLERLYKQLEVSTELRAVLMRPYLRERAKALLVRCDVDKAADYDAVKKYLLQEMRLSASVYWDKFNSITRENTVTYHQFSMRLMSLIEFYVSSRNVNESYQALLDLVVYDRIKSALSPFLAKHLLALESSSKKGWLGRQALVQALDSYIQAVKLQRIAGSTRSSTFTVRPNGRNGQNNLIRNQVKSTVTFQKRCYICGSLNHMQMSCPQRERNSGTAVRGQFSKNQTARVNSCIEAAQTQR